MILLVGQKGRLRFLAEQAGIPAASVTKVTWTQQGAPTAVKLTGDEVEALAVGTAQCTCAADGAGSERWVYHFAIEVLASEPAPPVALPIVIEPLA